jgi:adenylylsulfate kinase-like enzyme
MMVDCTVAGGRVIWITGLPCSGKSTVGWSVVGQLRDRNACALLLDGDELRAAIADPNTGYDMESRLTNAYRLARLAGVVASQGAVAVVATVSLFREVHTWNRMNLPGYLEVLLEADEEVRASRDRKRLRDRLKGMANVVGADLPYELPVSPHLRLDNGSDQKLPSVVGRIVDAYLDFAQDRG